MAIIQFPSSPTLNQTYTAGSKTWVWNGYAWDLQTANTVAITTLAQSAYNQANNAYNQAQNAYLNTLYTFEVDNTQNTSIIAIQSYANTLLPNTGSLITVNPVSRLFLPNTGTSSNPSLSIGSANTGLYSPASGDIGITANGTLQFYVTGVNAASNYLQVSGASSPNSPSITAQGSAANVSILMRSKGNGTINLQVQSTAANLTSFQIQEDTTIGTGISSLTLVGSSSTLGRVALRSSRALYLGSSAGNDIVFNTGATATSDGSRQFNINSVTSAVNYLQVSGATLGTNSPILSAQGSNTDINITMTPKGNGSIRVSGPPGGAAGVVLERDLNVTTSSARLFFDSSSTIFSVFNNGGTLSITSGASPANAFTGAAGTSGVQQFRVAHTGSAVNYLQVTGASAALAASGISPILSAQGSNTDINITMTPKGNGVVNLTSGLLFTGVNAITGANNGITFVDGTRQITNSINYVIPGTSGNVLTSNGTTWISSASAGGSSVPRVTSVANASTITPVSTNTDQYNITALAVPASFEIPSGSPVDGQKLTIRIKDNGTARALSWNISSGGYRIAGTTLPTTTVASKVTYVGLIYNSQDLFWDVLAVAQQT